MSIGSRIREARLRKGISQRALGEAVGATRGTIANYEADVSEPKSDMFGKLATVLDVSTDYLFQDIVPSAMLGEDAFSETDKALAEKLYDTLVMAGFIKRGQDLTDKQFRALDAIAIILDAVFVDHVGQ